MNKLYDQNFFKRRKKYHEQEVEIASIFYEVMKMKSCVDLGCGIGSYISGLKDLGVEVNGYEPWVDYISGEVWIPENVRTCILNVDCSIGFKVPKVYDCSICIEVAEHIPAPRAITLIDNICSVSNKCIFTAAEPGQKGTGHINLKTESYWKELFYINNWKLDRIATNNIKWGLQKLKENKMARDLASKVRVYKK